ncbi:dihydrofolate reductase [Candidatus Nomurabacteria bacterium]|nr:dihydrofolate reductase [Candidatus Nomurabacteria bacterium]
MISIIAAIGKNNELGKENKLLWSLPADMKHFKEITSGHTVIMGQKTFESIGRPLPNRKNIVVTRNKDFSADGVETSYSLEDTLNKFIDTEEEVFVIGGGEIYKQSMDSASKLYITHVEAEDKKADTFFPEIIPMVWNEISHEEHKKDDKNSFNYTFSIYEKFI